MSNFYLQANVSLIPIEEVTLDDGTTTTKELNSNIDRSFGSSTLYDLGTSDNLVHQEGISISGSSNTLDSLVTGVGSADTIGLIFIRLSSDSGAGEVTILWYTGMAPVRIDATNDWAIVSLGDSAGVSTIEADKIKLTVESGTSIKIDVLVQTELMPSQPS